jgi:predicted nuclease of predicted toxin-antitoxin system
VKLLIDENFPQKVELKLPGYQFVTVDQAGWKGKKNNELHELMKREGFSALITLDRNLPKQHDLKKHSVKIFVLNSPNSRPSSIQPLVNKLYVSLEQSSDQSVIVIS